VLERGSARRLGDYSGSNRAPLNHDGVSSDTPDMTEERSTMSKKSKRGPGPADKAVGLKVRQARMDADMSQADLGNKLGVSFQQIQKYERGTNRVTGARLVEIAKATGKPTTFFLEEPTYKPNSAGEKLAQFAASRLGHQLLEAAMPLDASLQQSLVNFTRALSREAA
jgi:transcriptional regulator with XRE-family HTH domain